MDQILNCRSICPENNNIGEVDQSPHMANFEKKYTSYRNVIKIEVLPLIGNMGSNRESNLVPNLPGVRNIRMNRAQS